MLLVEGERRCCRRGGLAKPEGRVSRVEGRECRLSSLESRVSSLEGGGFRAAASFEDAARQRRRRPAGSRRDTRHQVAGGSRAAPTASVVATRAECLLRPPTNSVICWCGRSAELESNTIGERRKRRKRARKSNRRPVEFRSWNLEASWSGNCGGVRVNKLAALATSEWSVEWSRGQRAPSPMSAVLSQLERRSMAAPELELGADLRALAGRLIELAGEPRD